MSGNLVYILITKIFEKLNKFLHTFRQGKTEWDGIFHQESYTPLFGPAVKCEIEQVIKTVCISRLYVLQEIDSIRYDIVVQRKAHSFLRKIFASIFADVSPAELKLQEIAKIPDILDLAVRSLSIMFDVSWLQVFTIKLLVLLVISNIYM